MTLLLDFPPRREMALPADQKWPPPNIVFIAKNRRKIIKENFVEGAPDIVVEILSPSNWPVDRGKKARVYAQARVREYWIVAPEVETIELFEQRTGVYALVGKYGVGGTVRSEVLAGLKIKVKDVRHVY